LSGNSPTPNWENELVRSLHKQLQATERELADQKWLYEQFLQSPSWRLTYPIRWLARQYRAVHHWILRRPKSLPAEAVYDRIDSDKAPIREEPPDTSGAASVKRFFTYLYRVQLQSFLTSNTTLELPRASNPEISILLVLFNRVELTLACLRALAENYAERMEIIIVDNNSRDETTLLLDRLRGARIIRNAENHNFLLAVNQAAKEARGEYLLLLNNDAQILPGTLHCALKTIRSAPDIGAVGGRLILLDGTLQEAGCIIWRNGSCLGYGRGDNPFAPMYMFRRDVDYCSGAFLLTPRRIWEELGGFDERFKPAYYEETDYCTRLWERQLRVVYEPTAALLHYEFASSGSTGDATDLQVEHQRVFATLHQNLLSTHFAMDEKSVLPARMKNLGKKRVLIIDDRVPHTWLGSGFPRARDILLTLLKQDFFVTFYPLSEFNEEWSSVYADMPPEIEFIMGYGPPLLEAFLRNRQCYYDTIVVSRPHNMKILKALFDAHPDWFEEANIIYDAEAIFAMRDVTLGQMNGTPLTAEQVDGLLQREMDLASAADCVLAVSETDGKTFLKHGIESVGIVGFSIQAAPTPQSFSGRNGFLFVGAIHEEASPNGDSMIWFLEKILPKIHAELGSDIPFTIAGVNKSERVKQLATSSVKIVGCVRDLTEIYNAARVFVAPTRYAAGIPQKVYEAASRGLPVVATSLLASQLGWEDGNPFLVGKDSDSFAQKCIELHRNSMLWEKLRDAAMERIRRECSVEVFESNLKDCLTRAGTGNRRQLEFD